MDRFEVPSNLLDDARRHGHEGWLNRLPETVASLAARWSLEVGPPFQPGGVTAWVAPARDAGGRAVVLKVTRRHFEADHEPDALRAWAGDGAVLLHDDVDLGDTVALLLERCDPGTMLSTRPEPEQDEVVAGLLRRLWREPGPGHPFRPLAGMCDEWAREFEAKAAAGRATVDPGLAREAMALFRSLPRTASRHVLLCTDLHAGNVLAAEREPWLVIDPKPYVGDPTYDGLQHMLNCRARLDDDPRALAARMADLLGLERERLLLWLFARCVQESPGWPGLADVARAVAPA